MLSDKLMSLTVISWMGPKSRLIPNNNKNLHKLYIIPSYQVWLQNALSIFIYKVGTLVYHIFFQIQKEVLKFRVQNNIPCVIQRAYTTVQF